MPDESKSPPAAAEPEERARLEKIIRQELFGMLVKAAPPMLDATLADSILQAGYHRAPSVAPSGDSAK